MKNVLILLGFSGLILIHLLILKTITYTAWPEMFSYPYLINHDFLIYRDFAHPYVPLLSLVLAFYYKIAGLSLTSNQFFTWGLILVNDMMIFLIARKFSKNFSALIPLTIYVLLQPIFEGNMLWFDLATTPLILGSFLSFIYIKDVGRKLFWFGFFLALALMVKQQVILFLVLSSIILVLSKECREYLKFYILGGIIPAGFLLIILLTFGIFKEYIFWTMEFPLIWLPKFPGYSDLPTTKNIIMLLLLFGLPVIWLIKNFPSLDIFRRIILVSIVATVVMAFPRFSYFHLQPAVAVLIIFYITTINFKRIGVIFLIIGISYGLFLWKDYRPFVGVELARFYDKQDLDLAKFVKENSREDGSVYFLGPHSLVFVLAGRIPPKPWIENFVWHFEIPGMQEKQIEGFKREEYLVIFKQGPIPGNWYDLGSYQPKEIIDYIESNYEIKGRYKSGIEVWEKISK